MALRNPTAKLRIRRFKEEDFKTIRRWHRERSMSFIGKEFYPNIGFIIDDLCAGFLVQTDSQITFIDGFISNPYSDKLEREEALDLLTFTLINFAHQRGFKKILAYTKHPSVKRRCRKYGFQYEGDDSLYSKGV